MESIGVLEVWKIEDVSTVVEETNEKTGDVMKESKLNERKSSVLWSGLLISCAQGEIDGQR